jgi:Flp pilus assembly protein TadD
MGSAISTFREITRLTPTTAESWGNLAVALEEVGEGEEERLDCQQKAAALGGGAGEEEL